MEQIFWNGKNTPSGVMIESRSVLKNSAGGIAESGYIGKIPDATEEACPSQKENIRTQRRADRMIRVIRESPHDINYLRNKLCEYTVFN